MWTLLQTLHVLVITKMVTSSLSSTLFLKQPGSYVEDVNDEVVDLSGDCSVGVMYKCMEKCLDKADCR